MRNCKNNEVVDSKNNNVSNSFVSVLCDGDDLLKKKKKHRVWL